MQKPLINKVSIFFFRAIKYDNITTVKNIELNFEHCPDEEMERLANILSRFNRPVNFAFDIDEVKQSIKSEFERRLELKNKNG